MSKEPDILDAAHTIRFHLRELFSDTEAETFDRKLAALLTKAESDEEAEDDIADLLCDNETTRKWTDEFLNTDETKKSYNGLPGEPYSDLPGEDHSADTEGMKKYVCPEENCGEFWYRWKVGLEIPRCRSHQSTLMVPADTRC